MDFTDDSAGWETRLRQLGDHLESDYWHSFKPVCEADISRVERRVNRSLPEDFRRFWLTIGSGSFPDGGNIYSPDDVIAACQGPLWMALGSGSWADAESQQRFYATRGTFNPAPERFYPGVTKFQGVDLLDLLQVGTDGSCCYLQVFVGKGPALFGYAELTPEGTFQNQQASFLEGLENLLIGRWDFLQERYLEEQAGD